VVLSKPTLRYTLRCDQHRLGRYQSTRSWHEWTPQSCRPPFQLLRDVQLKDSTLFKCWHVSFICGLLTMIVAQATFKIACLVWFESLDAGDWLCMRMWWRAFIYRQETCHAVAKISGTQSPPKSFEMTKTSILVAEQQHITQQRLYISRNAVDHVERLELYYTMYSYCLQIFICIVVVGQK
jgi:hypothetical protein